ncbi:hypothetical protein ABZ729_36770 [Streptomyces sp. NPDC006678]|uniref:hypothetical protein n=1 Tax=unclassified Streptomyces TaxID=2593676 RepID=UPI0033A7983A
MVEEAETGVVAAPVDALPLLMLGIGQGRRKGPPVTSTGVLPVSAFRAVIGSFGQRILSTREIRHPVMPSGPATGREPSSTR